MIEKMNLHYSFTNPASVHDEEALTALELSGRQAAKVNEVIEAQNKVREDVDNQIAKVIPETIAQDVEKHIKNGEFDKQIERHNAEFMAETQEEMERLERRFENVLENVVPGTSTFDAEIIDARTTHDGATAGSLGSAIRTTFAKIVEHCNIVFSALENNIAIDTTAKTLTFLNPCYTFHRRSRYDVSKNTVVSYAEFSGNVFLVTMDKENEIPVIIEERDINSVTHFPMFAVNLKRAVRGDYPFSIDAGSYILNGEQVPRVWTTDTRTMTPMLFSTQSEPAILIDTVNKTVTVAKSLHACVGATRYDLTNTTSLDYSNIKGTTLYIVVDLATYNKTSKTYLPALIPNADYKPEKHVILAQIQTNRFDTPYSQNINCVYSIDGRIINRKAEEILAPSSGNRRVMYVSPNGDDENVGTQTYPLRTIQQAIDKGAQTIYLEEGTYKEGFSLDNAEDIKILGVTPAYSTGAKHPRVKISFGEEINSPGLSSAWAQPWEVVKGTPLYDMYISQTLDLIEDGSRSDGYNAVIWNVTSDNPDEHYRLKPVRDAMESEMHSFWYDTFGYLNIEDDANAALAPQKYILVNSREKVSINKCRNVTLENLEFCFTREDALTVTRSTITARNCGFNYSALDNGIKMTNSNGEFHNCEAHHNRNDGFNLHDFGETSFINCRGYHNYDDGISHHDGCTGVIMGGDWHHNGKGGIASPTSGSSVNIYNVHTHHNGYGIYANSGEVDSSNIPVMVHGCCIRENEVGITSDYDMWLYGCQLTANGTDIAEGSTVQSWG